MDPKNASRFGIQNRFLQWQSGSADWLKDMPQAREGRLTNIIITINHTILITIIMIVLMMIMIVFITINQSGKLGSIMKKVHKYEIRVTSR